MSRMAAIVLALSLIPAACAQDGAAGTYEELMTGAHEHTQAARYDEAEMALAGAIEAARSDEERGAAIFTLATLHERRGDHTAASEVLARALELDGGGEWLERSLQRLGALAEQRRDGEMARRAWERLVEVLGPDARQTPELLIELARLAREAGELDRAAGHLEAVLERDGHVAWHRPARESLAELLLARGEHERALEMAREIDELARRRRLEMQIARHLIDGVDPARGERIAREVLAATPGYAPAMRLVHQAAVMRGAVEELREELRAEAEGDAPEAALTFLAEIARWEDDPQALLEHLRRLTELRPDDPDGLVSLGGAARDANRPEEAEPALRAALEIHPEHRAALTLLAQVLVQAGKTDEAVELLTRATNYDPIEPATVRSLDHALRRHSLHHERAKVIRQSREATGDARLMAFELAQVHIDLLSYDEAARELLVALEEADTPPRVVGMELERLVGDELAGEDVLAAVERHLDAATDPSDAERLALARVLLAAGQRERATALIEGTRGAGMAVADLARQAWLRDEDELAASLYEMALQMEIRDEERAEVGLDLARLHRDRGDWRAALEVLETCAITAARPLDAHPEALLMRAQLLTDHARLDEAREAWERLMTAAGGASHYLEAAREGMADWLFASGRLDEAEQAYAELSGDEGPAMGGPRWEELPPLPHGFVMPDGAAAPSVPAQTGSLTARAALRMAEIALRHGDVEEATRRFRYVADEHVDTEWANDALERLAFIQENLGGEGGAARRYFEALALRDRGEARMARDMLLEIAGTRGEPLADNALMVLAELRAEQGETRGAAETWVSVAEHFPESLLAPRALLQAALVQRDRLDDPDAAARTLQRLVDDYPESAAAYEAREKLVLLPPPQS